MFNVPHLIPASLLIILRCWKVDAGFAISLHRHCHHQFVTTPHTHGSCLDPYSPSFLTLHFRWLMCVLSGYQLSPDILVPLTLPSSERICCHLCIPAIIFWRFSPSQWKTECVWKLREVSMMQQEWQLLHRLYLLVCHFSGILLSALKVIAFMDRSPLNLHLH